MQVEHDGGISAEGMGCSAPYAGAAAGAGGGGAAGALAVAWRWPVATDPPIRVSCSRPRAAGLVLRRDAGRKRCLIARAVRAACGAYA